ncbi:MAG: hypothetical protein ACI89X_003343 [Planctomycetota bacterium]|jgi:hypothetical protein
MTVTMQPDAGSSLFYIKATGKLTREDYEQWVPALDAHLEAHKRASILFEMHDFHGWTAGALWADLKFGVQHFTSIDRIAIVGEKPWQKGMAMFCKPFTMARVRYFAAQDIAAARDWLHHEHGQAEPKAPFDFGTVPTQVAEQLRTLDSQDGLARDKARKMLVTMEPPVTQDLVRAAQSDSRQLRLEATRALATIADPTTATVLAAQFDDVLEIGWAAAEGVKRLGHEGAVAALRALVQHPNSHGVRTSAHHALRHMEVAEIHACVAPVAKALLEEEPVAAITVAADAALTALLAT